VNAMPYVNIRITREGATADQKARLISGVTDLLTSILGKNPRLSGWGFRAQLQSQDSKAHFSKFAPT